MIPRDEIPLAARVVSVASVVFSLAVVVAVCAACCAGPRVAAATTWAEYVERHPQYRDLSPDADHPGWRGRGGQVCGAGKCE